MKKRKRSSLALVHDLNHEGGQLPGYSEIQIEQLNLFRSARQWLASMYQQIGAECSAIRAKAKHPRVATSNFFGSNGSIVASFHGE